MSNQFTVAATVIIFDKYGRVLLTKRSDTKDKWPGYWTVPGGKVEESDWTARKSDTSAGQWYHVLEQAARREVKEETGLLISQPVYLCNLAYKNTIAISFVARALTNLVTLDKNECSDHAWVLPTNLKDYDIIEGIQEEIEMAVNVYKISQEQLDV